ncbi:hypothetical protein [Lacinutrix sp. Hel_I_90]|uniref:hypothetical protein n=1 Tax=Lacinutrix sp. Hel_I_90 TaxID=1249999 RepID=UPI0005C8C173|nr:hypothetical protein [Lacinutrix sp. Hel_I_90]
MAPIKFEEDLKDTLNKRLINPSEQAWETLSSRLDAEEQKESKTGFWWLAIAASVIGLLLVGYPFVKNDVTNPQSPTLVIDNKNKPNKIEEKITVPSKIKEEQAKSVLVNNAIEKAEDKTTNSLKEDNQRNLANTSSKQNKEVLASITINGVSLIENTLLIAQSKKAADHILVLNTKQEHIKNKDNTIDSLLSNARREIAMSTLIKNTNVPIDHNALLQDVEDDLEETFRDKLLKTVRKGYSSIREEIADRNN